MKRFLLALFTLSLTSTAAWADFDYQSDSKPWAEQQEQLPPYPQSENLLPFYVSATTDNRFFIDAPSISIGKDEVVRYTLVVKSSGGALNISFEGIRCGTEEYKIYAFARDDKTWAKVRDAQWKPIEYKERNRQQHVLYDDFFCPGGSIVDRPKEAIDALKQGFNPGNRAKPF
ncbi:MAG: CNP1-like family protein [Burkholderiales bacterium]